MDVLRRSFGTVIDFAAGGFAGTVGAAIEAHRLPPDDHRPWPLPREPWVMAQTWEHLLFAHWPVSKSWLESVVPASVPIDTFDGEAWLTISPFQMRHVRLRGLPAVPGLSDFHEINVRTYVTVGGKPGIWFFSLDADTRFGVQAARLWYRLPYFFATVGFEAHGERVSVATQRTHAGAPAATLSVRYAPAGDVVRARHGTLDWWLTERYCLYAHDDDGILLRAEIHHAPWPLQNADARIAANTMTDGFTGPTRGAPALVHYSRRLDVVTWRPRVVGETRRRPRMPGVA
jgi:uncharacterized protein YqjF (DUF2071 family)